MKAYGAESVLAPAITRPLAFQGATPNNNYLELSTEGGVLWRSINAITESGSPVTYGLGTAETIGSDGLYLDTLVQFTPTEDGGAPDLEEGDKLAIWLNVDSSDSTPVTNLMVQAKAWSYENEVLGSAATSFTVANVSVVAGQWYRLTVKAIQTAVNPETGMIFPAFQIFIDGTAVAATTAPYSSSLQAMLSDYWLSGMSDLAAANKLFPSLVETPAALNDVTLQGVGFKGSGALDDIVWTTEDPFAGGSSADDAWIAEVAEVFDGANLDSAEKAKITAWASANSITVASGSEEIAAAAYLLGLTSLPAAVPDLTITSIEEGTTAWTLTVAASVNDTALALPETINGEIKLKQAATLAGLASASASAATFTIANGTATVTVDKDAAAAKFMKVSVGVAPAAAPVVE